MGENLWIETSLLLQALVHGSLKHMGVSPLDVMGKAQVTKHEVPLHTGFSLAVAGPMPGLMPLEDKLEEELYQSILSPCAIPIKAILEKETRA
ncbi:hypothetical protein Ancab_012603 [Ancistrocladus abbreviatus]